MKQLENLDEETIKTILNIHMEMGVDILINENIQDQKDLKIVTEVKNNNKNEKTFLKTLATNSERKAFEIALQAKDIISLKKLFEEFDGCQLKKTASNFVTFEGNETSEILIIDGTPETEEDKIGKPFLGDKGELFNKMLKAIDLNREQIFIINSIPWRPPGNRFPTTDEINMCRPFVFQLISLLKPKIILCMGEVATNQILNLNESIINVRGKWHTFELPIFYQDKEKDNNKALVLPTFNISYLLKRPETKRQAWDDMKMLRDKIKEIIKK